MRLRNLSYRLIFPLLAMVSIVAFWRINKVNFFHHYIRVIAEVEERNSHELDKGQNLVVFSFASTQDVSQVAVLPFSQEALLADAAIATIPPQKEDHLSGRDLANPHPIRGP